MKHRDFIFTGLQPWDILIVSNAIDIDQSHIWTDNISSINIQINNTQKIHRYVL